MLPRDENILLCYINTKLRDEFPSLEALAEDEGEDAEAIAERLRRAGYEYSAERNAFLRTH